LNGINDLWVECPHCLSYSVDKDEVLTHGWAICEACGETVILEELYVEL